MYWNNSAPPATAMLAASTTSRTGRAVVMVSGSILPPPAVFQMRPHVPNGAADDDGDDYAVETMHEGLEAGIGVPALSELLADIGESIAPGPGAQERIELELSLRHARDACGERDEGADHRQQPADEDGDAAEAPEEPLDHLELALAHQHDAAPALDQRPAAPIADRVGDRRADIATDGARGRDQRKVEAAGRDEITGERHDDLGGERNAGALDRHQDDDAAVAERGNRRDDEGRDGCDDAFEQGNSRGAGRRRSGGPRYSPNR